MITITEMTFFPVPINSSGPCLNKNHKDQIIKFYTTTKKKPEPKEK